MAKMDGIKIKVGIMNCDDCEKMHIAMQMYNALSWDPKALKIIGYDKESGCITIDEDGLMHLIQLANPAQKEKKIILVKRGR